MENTLKQRRSISTFQRNRRKTHQESEMGKAVHDSLASLRRSRKVETHRRIRRRPRNVKVLKEVSGGEDVGDGDRAEVEQKIVALQRIVPGGEALGVDKLFEETAGYIMALQCQVKAMRVLSSFVEGLEKEKRKFGG